jgi:hypothetical protein
MNIPKFAARRALSLLAATALALSGTVALAGSSDAAVASLKLSPSTGGIAAGKVISITGKGFATAGGTSKVSKVWFSTGTCSLADLATNAATLVQAISSTKVVATAPALTNGSAPVPTVYNLCLSNTSDAAVIGTAKYTVYPLPVVNQTGATAANVGVSPTKGPVAGGTTMVIRGENFTAKSTATINGIPLTKVKVEAGPLTAVAVPLLLGDDTLTGVIPALPAGAGYLVKVTTEGGTSSTTTIATYTAENTVSVSPRSSDGTAGNGLTVTGSGFAAMTFGAIGAGNAQVMRVAGLPTSPVITASVVACGHVQVESDTVLNCTLTARVADGAWTVLVGVDASGTTFTSTTAMSTSATYTVADY